MHIDYMLALKENPLAKAGIAICIIVLAMALCAPFLCRHRPAEYTGTSFSPPSYKNWLGTNDVGQDNWSRLLYGARTSLITGCGVALISALLSILLGGTAALLGGVYEQVVMRITDALIVVPPVLIAILVAAYLRPNLLLLVLLLSSLTWPPGARIIRAQALSLKERTHVAASRTFGARWPHLLLHHIAPELGPIIVAVMVQDVRRAIFMEAGLSFLGISDPAMISWGSILHHAMRFTYLDVWKWWLLPVGLALSLTIMGFVFIGFGLETIINPRLLNET